MNDASRISDIPDGFRGRGTGFRNDGSLTMYDTLAIGIFASCGVDDPRPVGSASHVGAPACWATVFTTSDS